VRVDTPLPDGTLLTNAALITDTEDVTDTGEVTTPVSGEHTITLLKDVTPSVASPGDVLTYTLTWQVFGTEPAPDVTISDTLPAHTTFITATRPVIRWGNRLIWPLGDRTPGDSGFVTFTVQVDWDVPSGTVIYNAALITDTSDVTDTGETSTTILSPVLALDKRLIRYNHDDDVITFSIVITNVGPVVVDVVPLFDDYDHRFLRFAHATPYTPNLVITYSGWLSWTDLTEPPPHGFGHDLSPGERLVITTVFEVVGDITRTTNIAITDGDDDDEEIINIPTAVQLRYLRVLEQEDGLLIAWGTFLEYAYGYEIYRAQQATWDALSAQRIAFQPGVSGIEGADYVYLDTDVTPMSRYWYWLVALGDGGPRTRYGPVSALFTGQPLHYLYLPLVLRSR